MIRFTAFDRWGNQIGCLPDVIEAVHKDEVNGEDSLSLLLPTCDLIKGDRVVWRDSFGDWHEHTVADLKDTHEDGKLYTAVYCENSISELLLDYIEEKRPYNVTAQIALERALEGTRWTPGTVNIAGTASASFYHTSVREAITSILENWGGELSTTIRVEGDHVSAREVNITLRRGADNGKRFEWRKDIEGITREVSTDDVVTALYGYGKGLEAYDDDGNLTGGYERKLTFGEVNGGLDYVADEAAKERWGLPDGHGGVKHTFGRVEFNDCEDANELLALTKEELKRRCEPTVTYTANVIDLADAGFQHEDVRAGDTVDLIDRGLGERLSGRVLCVERYLFNEQATVITLGNISRRITDVVSDLLSRYDGLASHAGVWDGAGSLSGGWIEGLIASLNNTMNQTGGYTYYHPGEGLITYDKPEDQNPTMAIQIKGAGFRIANKRKSDGDWDWRTFGTGDGFTADVINAGTIRGGSSHWNLETGDLYLGQGSIEGGDNRWNLDTGELYLGEGRIEGGGNYWDLDTGTIHLEQGRVESSDGKNYWDLDSGTFHLEKGRIEGGDSYWDLNTGTLNLGKGRIEAANGSHWNLDNGEFQTVFVLSTGSASDQGSYTTATQKVVCVDMSASTAFGIYTGTRTRYHYDDGHDEYSAVIGKSFIGGITVSGSNVYLRANRVGTSNNLYATTGTTAGGNPGTSFVDQYGNYLDVEALRAQDDSSNRTTGAGLATFNKPFLNASTYYNYTSIYPPLYSNTYLTLPNERVTLNHGSGEAFIQVANNNGAYFSSGVASLRGTSTKGVFVNANQINIQLDNTHYILLTTDGVQCRCGSKGFGWVNGAFSDSLVWS